MECTNASCNSMEANSDDTLCDTMSTAENSEVFSTEDYNRQLQSRIVCLRETMEILKRQLHDEKEIWHRELEERRESDYISRAIEMGFQYFADGSPIAAASDGDFKLADTFLLNHFESRQNLQKQIAFANYKRRLLEVENMCNLELMRVKQNVQILQPLQAMCSEWKFPDEAGDAQKEAEPLTEEKKLKNDAPFEILVQKLAAAGENLITAETVPLDLAASKSDLLETIEPVDNCL